MVGGSNLLHAVERAADSAAMNLSDQNADPFGCEQCGQIYFVLSPKQ
jgi:hypothetical protein